MIFRWGRGCELDFSSRPLVMGILNVTPDSFSDGGSFFGHADAIAHARRMVDEGADIIDIGGMSTRPGSAPVEPEEEIRRTAGVIDAIAANIGVPVSIDTYRASVAKAALEAGASIINDISGLNFDPAMAPLAAGADVPVVLMHIKGTPRDMQKNPVYEALLPEIMDSLRGSIHKAQDAGIDKIIIDPGIGFGKTFDHNLEILGHIDEFAALGHPVLVGPSRKAFLGHLTGGAPESDRLEATAAAIAISAYKGVSIVRVHDVKAMSRVVRVAHAIRKGSS